MNSDNSYVPVTIQIYVHNEPGPPFCQCRPKFLVIYHSLLGEYRASNVKSGKANFHQSCYPSVYDFLLSSLDKHMFKAEESHVIPSSRSEP